MTLSATISRANFLTQSTGIALAATERSLILVGIRCRLSVGDEAISLTVGYLGSDAEETANRGAMVRGLPIRWRRGRCRLNL